MTEPAEPQPTASTASARHRSRRQAVVTAISMLAAAVVCGGGFALANFDGGGRQEPAGASASILPLPAIVLSDDAVMPGADLSARLAQATKRLSDAVSAGEELYTTARTSASPSDLERLRAALDRADAALSDELGDDATKKERTARLKILKDLRTRILDAAAAITQVRIVPPEELPQAPAQRPDPPSGSGGAATEADGEATPAPADQGPGSGDGTGGGSGGNGGGGGSGGTSEPAPEPSSTRTPSREPTKDPSKDPTTPPPSTPSPTPEPTRSATPSSTPPTPTSAPGV